MNSTDMLYEAGLWDGTDAVSAAFIAHSSALINLLVTSNVDDMGVLDLALYKHMAAKLSVVFDELNMMLFGYPDKELSDMKEKYINQIYERIRSEGFDVTMKNEELYRGRSKATNQTLKGPGRIDNGRYFIGEKVDHIGYRWYEVFPSTYKKMKGSRTDEK